MNNMNLLLAKSQSHKVTKFQLKKTATQIKEIGEIKKSIFYILFSFFCLLPTDY